jgi:hypothetical protein
MLSHNPLPHWLYPILGVSFHPCRQPFPAKDGGERLQETRPFPISQPAALGTGSEHHKHSPPSRRLEQKHSVSSTGKSRERTDHQSTASTKSKSQNLEKLPPIEFSEGNSSPNTLTTAAIQDDLTTPKEHWPLPSFSTS